MGIFPPYFPTVLSLCEILIPLCVGSIVTGSLSIYYDYPDVVWPISSGIGISTGVIGLVCAILGLVTTKKFENPEYIDKDFRCLYGVHWGFAIGTLICSVQEIAYSAITIHRCTYQSNYEPGNLNTTAVPTTSTIVGCGNDFNGSLSMAAVNVTLGVVISLLSVSMLIMYNLNIKHIKASDPEHQSLHMSLQ